MKLETDMYFPVEYTCFSSALFPIFHIELASVSFIVNTYLINRLRDNAMHTARCISCASWNVHYIEKSFI